MIISERIFKILKDKNIEVYGSLEADRSFRGFVIIIMFKVAICGFESRLHHAWTTSNARYFLLQLADQIEKNELLSVATDKQYGMGGLCIL